MYTVFVVDRLINSKNLFLCVQVVVNQDKASKQIATLRAEIQALMMELNEYKQVYEHGG